MNDNCYDDWKSTGYDYAVVIELVDGVEISEMNTTALLEVLRVLLCEVGEPCNVYIKDSNIGWKMNEQGYIVSSIIGENDEEVVDRIIHIVDELPKEGCEYGLLCKVENVYVILSGNVIISGGDEKDSPSLDKWLLSLIIVLPTIVIVAAIVITIFICNRKKKEKEGIGMSPLAPNNNGLPEGSIDSSLESTQITDSNSTCKPCTNEGIMVNENV